MMLLCGIIDELEKEPNNGLSYFFCQATEARLSNAIAVLRGLIYLLIDQQPSLISHVRKKHDYAGKQLFEDGNAWEALSKILTAMLIDPSLDDDANLCKEVLALASVVYRPITLEELKALVELLKGFDQDDLKEIIQSCGSFLTLREDVIYFLHQSAKDYLLNKASDQILPSGTAHQHHAIFSRSLEALSGTLRRDIYSLSAPGFSIDQISPPDPDPLASIRYSCVYWADHLSDSDLKARRRDLRDSGVIHNFFQKKYLYWLESLSLLRSMSEGVMAVQKLEALVKRND
ncbi:hypothetical protein QQX98_010504 [Neonectria punicea]|uniref:Nephrocystin 3-like N-terminal domain-containing protein n=1 Tax=Neonectria punicea TaxID=979145 RepID=A0ABR1GPD4_9HYPO